LHDGRTLVRTFIFLTGAPGSGKSSVAAALHRKLGTPLFEFGWIPEFRNTGTRIISYEEDESLAFENLALVLRNYARHGFRNIEAYPKFSLKKYSPTAAR